jgi:hypothetical protein
VLDKVSVLEQEAPGFVQKAPVYNHSLAVNKP